MKKERAVLTTVKAWLNNQNYQAQLVKQGDVLMLRTLLPVLKNEKGLVLVELFMTEYNQTADLVHLFATMTPPLERDMEPLQRAANAWNLVALAGCYGICEETSQLFYRHTVAVETDDKVETVARDAFRGLCVAMDEMARRLSEAILLSDPS